MTMDKNSVISRYAKHFNGISYNDLYELAKQINSGVDFGMNVDDITKGLNKEQLAVYQEYMDELNGRFGKGDARYNVPKEEPKVSEELVDETITQTEIYRRAKLAILKAQQKQVAYGIEKYPEPLNANTWSMIETIDHIIDESIDKLHYLVMLRIKLEQELAGGKTRD